MAWTCPHCGEKFAQASDGHECAGFKEYRVRGEVPNGGPGKDHDPALTQPLPIPEALRRAFDLVLMASGVRDGFESGIDPRSLHTAIRIYRPKDKFEHVGKSCNITPLDERMHAGRVAQRLLNQACETRLKLPGRWGEGKGTRVRIEALYNAIRALAEAHGIDPCTGSPLK